MSECLIGSVQLRHETNQQTNDAIKSFVSQEHLNASWSVALRSLTRQKTLKNILLIPNASSLCQQAFCSYRSVHLSKHEHILAQTDTDTHTHTLMVLLAENCLERPSGSHCCWACSHHALLLISEGSSTDFSQTAAWTCRVLLKDVFAWCRFLWSFSSVLIFMLWF